MKEAPWLSPQINHGESSGIPSPALFFGFIIPDTNVNTEKIAHGVFLFILSLERDKQIKSLTHRAECVPTLGLCSSAVADGERPPSLFSG